MIIKPYNILGSIAAKGCPRHATDFRDMGNHAIWFYVDVKLIVIFLTEIKRRTATRIELNSVPYVLKPAP